MRMVSTGKEIHIPVMVDEVIRYLAPKEGGVYIDLTCGLGGHTKAIWEAIGGCGLVIGIDRDGEALRIAKELRKDTEITFLKGEFEKVDQILREIGIENVDGILMDLGVSSFHLELSGRGFTYKRNEPLDMRFDPEVGNPLSHFLNTLREEKIREILEKLGEERYAKRIARRIVKERQKKRIEFTEELSQIIESSVPYRMREKSKMRTFMAFRIFVNNELSGLLTGLFKAAKVLKRGGRLVVLSYHSLEDRIVKSFMRLEGLVPLTKKPLSPSREEVKKNPRARSAKLRASEKTGRIDEGAYFILRNYLPLSWGGKDK